VPESSPITFMSCGLFHRGVVRKVCSWVIRDKCAFVVD
jgi:hypothetical protein